MGDLDVVETDDRQLAGHVEAALLGRLQHTEGHRVAVGENGRRRLRQVEQFVGHVPRLAPAVLALAVVLRAKGDARLLQRLAVAVIAVADGLEVERVVVERLADVGDAAVTQVN